MSFARLRDAISEMGLECDCLGPVDEAEVVRIERQFAVPLPDSYREFLLTYGALRSAKVHVCGVKRIDPTGPAPVLELMNRLKGWGSLPQQYIPVMEAGSKTYLLDTGRMSDGECPVIEWSMQGQFSEGNCRNTARNLAEWFAFMVRPDRTAHHLESVWSSDIPDPGPVTRVQRRGPSVIEYRMIATTALVCLLMVVFPPWRTGGPNSIPAGHGFLLKPPTAEEGWPHVQIDGERLGIQWGSVWMVAVVLLAGGRARREGQGRER